MSAMKAKVLKSKVVHYGRYVRFRVDRVAVGGREHTYEIVEHPGAVAVLPMTEEGKVLLEEQQRYALNRSILEIPAGTLEQGEEPEACARRELLEETGYTARELVKLGSIYNAPGYSTELIHLFFAKVFRSGKGSSPEPDETITTVAYTPKQVGTLIKNGTLCDSKSLSAIVIAERLRLLLL